MHRTAVVLKSAIIAATLMIVISAPLSAQSSTARAKAKADSVRTDSIRADSVKKANAKKTAAAKPATAGTKAATAPASNKATSPATKQAASTKTATAATKPATTSTKAAATTSKPASASASTTKTDADSKATTSTAKPATSSGSGGTSTSAPAKAAGSSGTTSGSSTSARTSGSSTQSARAAAATKAADTGRPRSQDPVAFTSVALYVGMAQGSLGFGAGPSGGLSLRIKRASLPIVFRFDAQGSRFSQTPTAFGGTTPLSDKATLTHVGATASIEIPLIKQGAIRPYLTAGGGVFRFQGSGPAGNNAKESTLSNGVFTSTTDGALTVGGGVRLGSKVFVEARYITVSDFNSIPVVLGISFK